MILPVLLALPAALGLLLQGAQAPWARALLHGATAAGTAAWLCARCAVGYVPRPSNRNLAWTAGLAALGTASYFLAMPSAVSAQRWCDFLVGLWFFPVIACVSKDERALADAALRACAWVLMLLAFYQRLRLGDAGPAAAVASPALYAGTLLMLLPLALEMKDWLLAAGLAVNFVWAASIGAWSGLAGALVITRLRHKDALFWAGLAAAFACAVLFYGGLQSEAMLERAALWREALRLAAENPLFGAGAGRADFERSMYLLRSAAEYGIVFSAVWFAGLWSCVLRGSSYKRFGALAVLIHSLWDGVFLVPANFWLFAYFAASSLTEEDRGVNVPLKFRPAACAAAAAAGGWLSYAAFRLWASGAS